MNDTIVAPASAIVESAVIVIRLSGREAIKIVNRCFSKDVYATPARTAIFGTFKDPDTDEAMDKSLVTVFRAPASYTGEDLVECSIHGNPVLASDLIKLFIRLGARYALPGEFTQRAYLHGKLDLSQAEAVNSLIRAHTRHARNQALWHLNGDLSKRLLPVHESILHLLSLLEVAIDHSDEELDFAGHDKLMQNIDDCVRPISDLISTARSGQMLTQGMRVALIGAPNVGKSSLMNALLKKDRVIVTDIPGTTRDIIEEEINIKGLPVRLIDTAGIRDTNDHIERLGIARSIEQSKKADLRVLIFDASRLLNDNEKSAARKITDGAALCVLNKIDLPIKTNVQTLEKLFKLPVIPLSAKNYNGLDELETAIEKSYYSHGFDPENDLLIANARQETCLRAALGHLNDARAALEKGLSEEFIASDIRKARLQIEEISGKTDDDAILDRIFANFCVGK